MKILLTGANGYIGSRLIPCLLEKGHEVVCVVRDKKYFPVQNKFPGVTVLNGDLLRAQSIEPFPVKIDVAFYLANRLTQTSGFAGLEALSAQHFMDALNKTHCTQLITVSDFSSTPRTHIENILASGRASLTGLQTSMVIGEGSISLELFYALTQNTPIVITRSWAKTNIQPVYIDDVLAYLEGCLLNKSTFNHKFDIGGPQVLTFKQMMLLYIATYHETKPDIVILPLLNTKLATYLVNFLSPTSYPEAQSVIQNLSNDSVCNDETIRDILPHECVTFKQSLKLIHDKANKGVLI
jgi:uncharacterized protein YbjT (DUF2867 family)